jgi:diaminopimelate decarboxylase
VGNAGVLLTEVLVLKPGRSDDGGKNFCIVDAAMNDLAAPGHVPSLDGHRALRAAQRRRPRVGRGGPGVRIGRLAGP